MFGSSNSRHDTGSFALEIVSLLSYRESEAMVHPHNRNMTGDWKELRDDFCYSFSLTERIDSLLIDILSFEQLEKESISAAWARFLRLLASSPDVSAPDDVCNNRFIKGHKPSNHIRGRIKSHVYTTE